MRNGLKEDGWHQVHIGSYKKLKEKLGSLCLYRSWDTNFMHLLRSPECLLLLFFLSRSEVHQCPLLLYFGSCMENHTLPSWEPPSGRMIQPRSLGAFSSLWDKPSQQQRKPWEMPADTFLLLSLCCGWFWDVAPPCNPSGEAPCLEWFAVSLHKRTPMVTQCISLSHIYPGLIPFPPPKQSASSSAFYSSWA